MSEIIEDINFSQDTGLVPCIVQDYSTKEVLMLAYMNREAVEKNLETGYTWFYSRSRQKLWQKGETSGNKQEVVSLTSDCDQDTLLAEVKPSGPSCHTGEVSCFFNQIKKNDTAPKKSPRDSKDMLDKLQRIIDERLTEKPEGSYVVKLTSDENKVLKKVGEEATELVMASKDNDSQGMIHEGADLLFHMMVLFKYYGVEYEDIMTELQRRHDK